MATLLDIGLLELLKPAITFMFIFAILLAILLKTKLLGDNVGLSLLAALGGSLLFLLTPGVVEVVNIMTPWFVVMFILLILIVLIFLFMGVSPESVAKAFKDDVVKWTLIIVSIVIIFGYAMTKVFGAEAQKITSTGGGNIVMDIGKILFHPKLLGVVFILVIISFAVRIISENVK